MLEAEGAQDWKWIIGRVPTCATGDPRIEGRQWVLDTLEQQKLHSCQEQVWHWPGARRGGDRKQLGVAGDADGQPAIQRRGWHTLALAEAPEGLRQPVFRTSQSIAHLFT